MNRFAKIALVVAGLLVAAVAVAEPLSASGILPANLGRGLWVFRVRTGDTTANTKIAEFKNAAGTVKFSADIEGDVVAAGGVQGATVYSVGNLTVGSGVFSVAAATGNLSTSGTIAASGAISGKRQIITASSGSTPLEVAQSGALVANTGTSGTTTFVLPAAAAGLHFCFVEAGDAAGELLINPASGDVIIGKTHGANDGTGIATTAGSGVKNSAGSNVKGDFACFVAIDATNWVMDSVAGVWAAQ